MNVYAFDVDETLEVSAGPVKIQQLADLRTQGHIVGLCGNWAGVTTRVAGWHHIISFVGPLGIPKDEFLKQLKMYVPADDYILVGNDHNIGVYRSPNDYEFARLAGWKFINEIEFSKLNLLARK